MRQAGRLPEPSYPGPRRVETGRTQFHAKGTECTGPREPTEEDQGRCGRDSPGGMKRGTPEVWAAVAAAGPLVSLQALWVWSSLKASSCLLCIRICKSDSDSQGNLKVLAPPTPSSGGLWPSDLPCFISLHRTLLQVQGKTQPWREGKGNAAPGLPVCGPSSPSLTPLNSPTLAPRLQLSQTMPVDRDPPNAQPSRNPSDLSPQEPQPHTHLALQTTPQSTT